MEWKFTRLPTLTTLRILLRKMFSSTRVALCGQGGHLSPDCAICLDKYSEIALSHVWHLVASPQGSHDRLAFGRKSCSVSGPHNPNPGIEHRDVFAVNGTNDRETEGYTAADYIQGVSSDSLLGPI